MRVSTACSRCGAAMLRRPLSFAGKLRLQGSTGHPNCSLVSLLDTNSRRPGYHSCPAAAACKRSWEAQWSTKVPNTACLRLSSALGAAHAFGSHIPGRQSVECRLLACAAAGAGAKKKLVFLGTPEVAAGVLQQLLDASHQPGASFEVAAVVSQPGRPKGRGKKPSPSPVAEVATAAGLGDQLLCPASAREEGFLERLRALAPDLCVTAAYGNILPQRFLDIPARGTLNVHPSLLPKLRGAAPVQRALEAGLTRTGVSVAFTVRAMDAGPVLAQDEVEIDPNVQAPQLLADLFDRGARLLLQNLPVVWDGRGAELAVPQDDAVATHAAKLAKEDGRLNFALPAATLHNQVRAYAGWPGTSHTFLLADGAEVGSQGTPLDMKELVFKEGALFVLCGDGRWLQITHVQPAGKKPMAAQAFWNGMKGRRLLWQPSS